MARFFSERVPLDKISYDVLVRQKTVPIHRRSWGYYTGGLVLLFLLVQVVTGILLLFYYEPTVSEANASVAYLTRYVPNGEFLRNTHAWSASFMIGFLLVHLLTTFSMKSFDRPRELTWLAGVLLLFLTFAFGFTGYLLPWNQIAVNATKVVMQSLVQVGTYLPHSLAGLPEEIRVAFQGEQSIGQATLSRFFAIHVVLLPVIIAIVLGFHLLSVQLLGMSQGVDVPATRHEPFFPSYILKDLSLWTVLAFVLVFLALTIPFAAFLPYPLTEPFYALGPTPEGIKPEWYFYFIYYPLELLPFWVVMIGMIIISLGLFFVPWVFHRASRRVLTNLAVAAALYLIIITVFGHEIYRLVKGVS
jgi:quinol-cytochrome oxidoreductase complex cytochrome b subunit